MRRLIPTLFLFSIFLAGAQTLEAQSISGEWEITWETQRGVNTTTFNFQQDGDTFTGSGLMMMGGRGGGGGGQGREVEISDGTIDGNTFSFTLAIGRGDRTMSLTFSGTIDGDSMEGTMTTPRGENPFTGEKK